MEDPGWTVVVVVGGRVVDEVGAAVGGGGTGVAGSSGGAGAHAAAVAATAAAPAPNIMVRRFRSRGPRVSSVPRVSESSIAAGSATVSFPEVLTSVMA
jgi:hypothetical protein